MFCRFIFVFPEWSIYVAAGPEETKNQAANVLRLIQIRLAMLSLAKSALGCQDHLLRIAYEA